jgi:hypothetical protein
MILAFDPGGTTGIAMRIREGLYQTTTAKEHNEVYALILKGLDHVVVEGFATGGRISVYGLSTVELVGGITALCYDKGIPLTRHVPQKRRPWLKPARAYLENTMGRGKYVVHEVDALAHLMAYEYLSQGGKYFGET